jgi:hypothetical protein
MKKIEFKEENQVITVTLTDDTNGKTTSLNLTNYTLTGEQIFKFLSYSKGDKYDIQGTGESDSVQMKELKGLFGNIKDKINSYSPAVTTSGSALK